MLHATSRMLYGGSQHNPPSRFLSEIGADYSVPSPYSDGPNLDGWAQKSSEHIYDDEPHYVPELTEGDRVRHQIFGVGTVVELDGETCNNLF